MAPTQFLLGGSGFIGQEVIRQAVEKGYEVRALGRSSGARSRLAEMGAHPVPGDAAEPSSWGKELRGADVLIDLLQPNLPRRLTPSAVETISRERQALTAAVLEALQALPVAERPLLFFVSGADDLQPDADGRIDHDSPRRSTHVGFSRIGVPVRALIESSSIEAAYMYFGNLVYGPGKVFAELIVDGLRKRRARVLGDGSNRLPLTHVTDAAGALVHLAGLPRDQLAGRSFLASDGSDTTQRELLNSTAALMGRKPPGSVPIWLAALVAGRAGVETLALDVRDDPAALLATGFKFRYPSHREGVPATLERLGQLSAARVDAGQPGE
jgi:nucleoside-diphosphate-sugar epimerase